MREWTLAESLLYLDAYRRRTWQEREARRLFLRRGEKWPHTCLEPLKGQHHRLILSTRRSDQRAKGLETEMPVEFELTHRSRDDSNVETARARKLQQPQDQAGKDARTAISGLDRQQAYLAYRTIGRQIRVQIRQLLVQGKLSGAPNRHHAD